MAKKNDALKNSEDSLLADMIKKFNELPPEVQSKFTIMLLRSLSEMENKNDKKEFDVNGKVVSESSEPDTKEM